MDTWVWIAIAAVAAVVVLGVLWSAARTRRTRSLQDRFGREYDRAVEHAGDRREAERELREREKRHAELELRPLAPEARDRYVQEWQETQGRFVDDPKGAVKDADRLVQHVMKERGYPVDDFEQRAADVSVDHPVVVENYRAAHDISAANANGTAKTEDLRQAMVHYRALFDELLGADVERTREDEARNDIREVR
jgi:hypothetical protein